MIPRQYFRVMDTEVPLCCGPCGHFFEQVGEGRAVGRGPRAAAAARPKAEAAALRNPAGRAAPPCCVAPPSSSPPPPPPPPPHPPPPRPQDEFEMAALEKGSAPFSRATVRPEGLAPGEDGDDDANAGPTALAAPGGPRGVTAPMAAALRCGGGGQGRGGLLCALMLCRPPHMAAGAVVRVSCGRSAPNSCAPASLPCPGGPAPPWPPSRAPACPLRSSRARACWAERHGRGPRSP